ncbi:MAG: hypothetical protein ACTS78_02540 [Arsenophonus sp. NC-WZS1-MAG3]
MREIWLSESRDAVNKFLDVFLTRFSVHSTGMKELEKIEEKRLVFLPFSVIVLSVNKDDESD